MGAISEAGQLHRYPVLRRTDPPPKRVHVRIRRTRDGVPPRDVKHRRHGRVGVPRLPQGRTNLVEILTEEEENAVLEAYPPTPTKSVMVCGRYFCGMCAIETSHRNIYKISNIKKFLVDVPCGGVPVNTQL